MTDRCQTWLRKGVCCHVISHYVPPPSHYGLPLSHYDPPEPVIMLYIGHLLCDKGFNGDLIS